ncbi:hypothetical protein [Entomomonas asaccharolytica]|uniref:Uncharacterized protein n=1 Tax=Entomomonas asaccharolytica TaxID=2785331 RepID=A0A974NHX0_9GAMM|nr:hypothetical protein [Entomomonas asaccharolytica]QQP86911.1 hypothetical protein JHT90_06615 [Entomomonas asaccharolytica]
MANQVYIKGQASHDLANDPAWNRPEPQFFVQSEVNNYINQLMTTGSCPELCGDATGAPMNYEEAYKLVIEIMTLDAA